MNVSLLSIASLAVFGVSSLFTALFGQRAAVCDCSADKQTLALLQTQLDRCGPENLSARVFQAERGISEQLIPVLLALALGSLIGSVITLAVNGKPPRRQSLSVLAEIDTYSDDRIGDSDVTPARADAFSVYGERWVPNPGSIVRRIQW